MFDELAPAKPTMLVAVKLDITQDALDARVAAIGAGLVKDGVKRKKSVERPQTVESIKVKSIFMETA